MVSSQDDRLRYRRLMRFSLRSLLVLMALVAAYAAGWMSHREWNRRHLEETLSTIVESANGGSVQVESVEGTGVLLTRGRKEDVERVNKIVNEIENAARR